MINANLLPPDVKSEITQTKKNRVIVRYFGYAVLIFVVAIAIFLTTRYYFSQNLTDAQKSLEQKQNENKKYGAVTERTQSYVKKINTINSIDTNSNKWSGVIIEVQKVMPSGAYLTSVKMDSDGKVRGQISGYAASKQIVASLRDSLEKSSKFQYVDIDSSKTQVEPTSQKEQEYFALSFSLEKGALK
jgi:Tfp pilus assembly protein PilN